MANRTRRLAEAARFADQSRRELADEFRRARMNAGMTLADCAHPLGWSRQKASRMEAARIETARLGELIRYASVLGLRLRVRAYPVGAPLRDVAQLAVTRRFRARLGDAWRVTLEAPIGIPSDLRAFDLLLRCDETRIVVEVITRLTDVQAQLRALQLKHRDGGICGPLLIVVAESKRNREALRFVRPMLADDFPIPSRLVWRRRSRMGGTRVGMRSWSYRSSGGSERSAFPKRGPSRGSPASAAPVRIPAPNLAAPRAHRQ